MAAAKFERYGRLWPAGTLDIMVEMECIRLGMNPLVHYENMRRILWPRLDDHRWHRLCLKEIRRPNAKVTVLMGAGSTGKTHEASWNYLCEYFCWPDELCLLVSSSTLPKLRQLVWGEICMLWQEAKDKYDWLPGHLLEHRIAITTDALEDGDWEDRRVRDMRKAIVGIPCVVGNKVVGLSKYQGVKQKRIRLIADEASVMSPSFLSAFSNLNNNEDFQAIILGNPSEVTDALGKAAEPVDDWQNHMQPEKTEVWDTRFYSGRCVNLVGTDSPNFDFPPDKPSRYRYLIDRRKIEETAKTFNKDSYEYFSQCLGVMKISALISRVLTRDICEKGHAFDDVIWEGSPRTRIGFLDSAWGGDRCVFTWGEFGREVGGKTILKVYPPEIIPITLAAGQDPDYVISEWIKRRCEDLDIPPANFGHDSTGRGSLGTALARVWSAACNPVEFGQQPTNRPVSSDHYWNPPDDPRNRRIKLCKEHYSKFVTELWFSVRYCVEAGQLRGLTEEVFDEFYMRMWKPVRDDKIEVEPKSGTAERPGMKQRTGRSPDLADSCAGLMEMARRRGFEISKLENKEAVAVKMDWLRKMGEAHRRMEMSHELDYTVA